MKQMLMGLVLVQFMVSVHAQEAWQSKCKSVESLSKVIMENRQNGVPMSKQMGIAEDSKMIQKIVIEAYDTPKYSTKKHQNRTINEFSNKWYSGCAKFYLKNQ